jgi:ATP-dependent helicase/nuclease subunit B
MAVDFPFIASSELFGKLAEGAASGITVVTPNARLTGALLAEFDARQVASGLSVWQTPDILPFDAFVRRFWEDALHAEGEASVPLLLTSEQEQVLWEEVIEATRYSGAFLSTSLTAAQCRSAWVLANEWHLRARMAREPGNEDSEAFLDWSVRYEALTAGRGQTDHARLADVVAHWLPLAALRKPASLVLHAFDLATPQRAAFIDALAAAGTKVVTCGRAPVQADVRRVALPSARDEIVAAAKWARARLEGGGTARAMPRIGVVVPDLGSARERVRRIFTEILQPGRMVPGTPSAVLPFDISIGPPLASYPLVHDALLLLRLAGREVSFEEASRALRSPFLAGAESEFAQRARLDASMRRNAGATTNLDGVLHLMDGSAGGRAPTLRAHLEKLAQFRRSDLFAQRDAAQWARSMSKALTLAGFPAGRTLDSTEYQTLQKWHEVLASFAVLSRVVGKMGYARACDHLARIAGDTPFQPRTRDVPIAILGLLESAGLAFDHLWVMGLTDVAWPLAARPDPFIPVHLQREAGIPQADPSSSLALDRRLTEGWLHAAPEVVVSHAQMREDAELLPSPLIAGIALREPDAVPAFETLRDAIFRARAMAQIVDRKGPALAPDAPVQQGGARLFADQSACPFRAFAHWRLRSKPVESPQPGVERRHRGTLLHVTLAGMWEEMRTRDGLEAAAQSGELRAIAVRAADAAVAELRVKRPGVLQGRSQQIERDRLVARALEWLVLERTREDFAVVDVEREQEAKFGGVAVSGRIDRIDRLAQGGHALIDYKSGQAKISGWFGHRPEDPQLPLYALAVPEVVDALAFAKVKIGGCRFDGVARVDALLPGVRDVANVKAAKASGDWEALRTSWRGELEGLGQSYVRGEASVDPKRGTKTCTYCDQALFCRIAEKEALRDEEDDE